MKQLFFYYSIICLFSSCSIGYNTQFVTEDEAQKIKKKHLLQSGYYVKTERNFINENSYFDSEFQFIKADSNNTLVSNKMILILKSHRTGEKLKKQILIKIDDKEFFLPIHKVEIQNSEFNSTETVETTRSENVTVCIPERKEEVTKADGTKETVTIPATSEIQAVTVKDESHISHVSPIRIDRITVFLNDAMISEIKKAQKLSFKIYYEEHGVWLNPYLSQIEKLKIFL